VEINVEVGDFREEKDLSEVFVDEATGRKYSWNNAKTEETSAWTTMSRMSSSQMKTKIKIMCATVF
jgi:hypothetical protein